jgi:integrase
LGYDGVGKRRRRTVYAASKQEAKDKLLRLQGDAHQGRLADTTRQTLTEFLRHWLDNIARLVVAPTTLLRYRQLMETHVIQHLGTMALAKLNADHIEWLWSEMEKAEASADARYKAGVVLGTALQYAVEKRKINHNPLRDVPKKSRPRPIRRDILPLDADQTARFLKAAKKDHHFVLYVLALDTGMRQGELFGLQWEDIDWDSATVQVRHSLEEIKGEHRLKDVKTKHSRRRIKLAGSTLGVLHEHRKKMTAKGLGTGTVFCDGKGGWLRKSNVRRRSFEPILKRAGLPSIRFHDLRHTTASLLLLANVHPKAVSERLGHSSIQVTVDVYSHLLPTTQDSAAAQMERLLNPPKRPTKRAKA